MNKAQLDKTLWTIKNYISSNYAAKSHTHNYAGSSSAGGAANSAAKLSTARTISLTGDVTGSASFDGSANTSITATIANNSHNHTVSNITDLRLKNIASATTTAPVGTWANSSIKDNSIIFGGDYGDHSTTNANIVFSSNKGVVNMVIDGEFYADEGQNKVYHAGNKPTPADIGAAASSHTHKSLELSGNNTISLTDDTTTKWGAQKNSIHYYSTTGKLTDQPGQYGILCNFTNGDKEVHQLWLTQSNGNILHRGGNAEGWNTVSWLTLLDSANYQNYVFPKAGGTLTGKITFAEQLGGGGLSSLINCNALHNGTGNGQLLTTHENHIYIGNPKTPITIEGNTHPKVNVNGTEYTMYHTGNKPSPADIGAAASGHVHYQVESLGNVTAETGANHPSQPGLSMRHVYNNGYPVSYGNVLTMRGAGSNQILTEWSGSDGGAGRLYIRNKRDTSGDWSAWAQVYTSAHKPSPADIGAAASNHTHNYAASNHTHDYAAASHNHGLMHSDLGVSLANTSTDSGWSMINGSYNGYILKSIRSNQYAPAWHLGNYSAGICFGGADTKGVLSCSYDHAEARFAGGNGSKPVWWFGLQGKSGTTYNLDSFNAARWGGYTVRTGAGATGVSGAITFSW